MNGRYFGGFNEGDDIDLFVSFVDWEIQFLFVCFGKDL